MKISRLECHFAASAAICLAGGTAGADVVAWTNCNLVVPATTAGLYINLELQTSGTATGTPGWDLNPYGSSTTAISWYTPTAAGSAMMRYPGATTGTGNLATGTVVGPGGTFGTSGNNATFGANPGQWQYNGSNAFGFRFKFADASVHYGWGTMEVGANAQTRTVTNLYFESLPDTAIVVDIGPPPPYDPCGAGNPPLANGANTKPYRADAADQAVSCGTVYAANVYPFTPGESGPHTIEACVPGASIQMAVRNACDALGFELACGVPACDGFGSAVTMELTGGTTVYVVIGGSAAASGLSNSVSVNVAAPPLGACVNAMEAVFGDNAFENSGFGPQTVKSNAAGTTTATIQKAVWYRFVPGATGAYSLKTCGSVGDTMLAIGTVCPSAGARFEAIAFNDDAPLCPSSATGNLASFIDATNNGASGTYAGFPLIEDLVAGQTYYILAGSFSATAVVTGILNIDGPPQSQPCPGDFDDNGVIDGSDLGTLLASFGIDAGGDIDGDGFTDGSDLGLLLAVYGTACP